MQIAIYSFRHELELTISLFFQSSRSTSLDAVLPEVKDPRVWFRLFIAQAS